MKKLLFILFLIFSNLLGNTDIESAYKNGLNLTRTVLNEIKEVNNLDKYGLMDECEDSLFYALFANTPINTKDRETRLQYLRDCKKIAKQLFN